MSRFLFGILAFAAVIILAVYFFFGSVPESALRPEPSPTLRGPVVESSEKSSKEKAKISDDDEDDEDDKDSDKDPDGFTRT